MAYEIGSGGEVVSASEEAFEKAKREAKDLEAFLEWHEKILNSFEAYHRSPFSMLKFAFLAGLYKGRGYR